MNSSYKHVGWSHERVTLILEKAEIQMNVGSEEKQGHNLKMGRRKLQGYSHKRKPKLPSAIGEPYAAHAR